MNASEIVIRRMVLFAVFTFGYLITGTALLTASIPVYVPAPMLYECRIIKSSPVIPIPDVTSWTSVTVLFITVGTFARWVENAYIINITWVIAKSANIGIKYITASFIPLKFNNISITITEKANHNLVVCQFIGRKLSTASTPLAIEMEIVST